AARSGQLQKMEDELGDVLFSVVNLARFMPINPEDALRGTIEKFTRRFQYVERKYVENQKDMKTATLEEMDQYWDEAKRLGY
ncbi:MAG TPA: MazG nucleotide pyrophosphohydrolase domain-containing protein, partial [bacterium]|nr:MazG nucleotide pyrophosphohydrolase domain-containing protein [bacterium]